MRMMFFLFSGFWLFLTITCTHASGSFTPAFYYWQTTFRLSPPELRYLDSLGCRKLYVKFLDIGRDPESGQISPLAMLDMADTIGLSGKQVIPCVFITNNVFQNTTTDQIDWLAKKTTQALQSVGAQFPARVVIPENVQFDCDWTASSREAYFAFLRKMKTLLPSDGQISATVRLHQYKFPGKTGVPPVDRGMLMFYNTGDIDDPAAENSIFQTEAARKYVEGAPAHYPLPLDVVLPVFSWGLIYRDAELWKIIPGLYAQQLRDTALFSGAANPGGGIRVLKGTFQSGLYLRPGDQIRLESVSPELLGEAAALAAKADKAGDATVAFYHLDTLTVSQFPVETIKSAVAKMGVIARN